MNFSREFRKLLLQKASLEKFVALLERCNDCNYILKGGKPDSLIHLSVVNDRLDVVKLLVQQGASLTPLEIRPKPANPYPEFHDFGFDDDDRFTNDSLITAAQRNQDIFNFLAPLASAKQRKQATLYLAEGVKRNSISNSENEDTFQQLVDARPTTDSEDFGQWLSDLAKSTITETNSRDAMRAASLKFTETCRNLMSQRIDINHVYDNGCTLLWTAAHNGYVEAVKLLIDSGAFVDAANQKDAWTPLMIAADAHLPWTFGTMHTFGKNESRQVEVVHFLLQAGADVNYQGTDGETALSVASEFDQDKGFEVEVLDLTIRQMRDVLSGSGATEQ